MFIYINMSFLEIFNYSFLITFVVFTLLIGLVWIHFNQKLTEQNLKINQMVQVLTTMTYEVNLIRNKIGFTL